MAAIPANHTSAHRPQGRSRLRRWLLGVLVAGSVLAAYGYALRWLGEEVGQNMHDSMRDVPVLDDHTPRAN